MERKDAPAFPGESASHYFTGITRREYIAIEAMKSLIVNRKLSAEDESAMTMIAKYAYKYADAMIKEGTV